MKVPYKTGFSFGLTSGIITTLGMMMGLFSGTHSSMVVVGGILSIAITDAFSDAIAMHLSQETNKNLTDKDIWQASISTFLAKFFFCGIFMIPVLLLELNTAIIVSIAGGIILLAITSILIAEEEGKRPIKLAAEHVLITIIVLITTYYAGIWVDILFSK